jgi:hypothetical protein
MPPDSRRRPESVDIEDDDRVLIFDAGSLKAEKYSLRLARRIAIQGHIFRFRHAERCATLCGECRAVGIARDEEKTVFTEIGGKTSDCIIEQRRTMYHQPVFWRMVSRPSETPAFASHGKDKSHAASAK